MADGAGAHAGHGHRRGHEHGHGHGHGHHHHGPAAAEVAELRGAQRRALQASLALNAAFLLVELGVGLATGSLALLADAAHLASDVGGLVVALVAARLAARPATDRYGYGLRRAEVVGAQLNGALLVGATAWIGLEAVQRLRSPAEVEGGGVLVVAVLGLAANLVSFALLRRVAGRNLGVRAAAVHMAVDAAASGGAIVAGALLLAGVERADPAISLAIGALTLWSALRLLRQATAVLLEATPAHVRPGEVEALLRADDEVTAVHHVHLWNLGSDEVAMSGHVVLHDQPSLHAAQAVGERLKATLARDVGIAHATLELECHPCDEEEHR